MGEATSKKAHKGAIPNSAMLGPSPVASADVVECGVVRVVAVVGEWKGRCCGCEGGYGHCVGATEEVAVVPYPEGA